MSDDTEDEVEIESMERRLVLLAQMAAQIAAGTESNPSCDHMDVNDIAERAVEVAEAILVQVGL